jgi:hypothetical protein
MQGAGKRLPKAVRPATAHAFVLVFLPVALAGFDGLRWSDAERGWYLVLISLVFYRFWDVRFVGLRIAQALLRP